MGLLISNQDQKAFYWYYILAERIEPLADFLFKNSLSASKQWRVLSYFLRIQQNSRWIWFE